MRERSWMLGTVGVLAACYASGLPTSLGECDAGEFIALALHGGIAHPPGYPLFTMLLRAVAAVASAVAPVGAVVPTLAAVSMVCVLGGAALLFVALRSVTASAMWRATAVVIVGTMEPVWRAATAVEPFGLNLLLAGVVVAAAARRWTSPGSRWAPGILGLAFGLGLCHHHSLAFLAPVALAALLVDGPTRARALATTALGFALGCTPLLYLLVEDKSGALVWGDWTSPGAGLWDHLRRTQYGSLSLVTDASGPWWGAPAHYGLTTVAHLTWLWTPVVLGGAVVLARTASARPLAIGLGASAVLFAAFFSLFRLTFPFVGEGRIVAERFFALPDLMLAFPLVAGLERVARQLRAWPLLAALMIVPHLLAQASTSVRSHDDVYEAAMRDTYRVAGPRGVVITTSDADLFGAMYLRARGAELEAVHEPMMVLPWYRRRVLAALWPDAPAQVDMARLTSHLLTSGRTVVLGMRPSVPEAFSASSYPLGPVVRLLPPGEEPPEPLAVYRLNVAFDAASPVRASLAQGRSLDGWGALRLEAYERTWRSLARALADAGLREEAADATARAERLREAMMQTRQAPVP